MQFNRISFYVMLVQSHSQAFDLLVTMYMIFVVIVTVDCFVFLLSHMLCVRIYLVYPWDDIEKIFFLLFHRLSIETFKSMSFLHLTIRSILIHHQTNWLLPFHFFCGCFSPFSFLYCFLLFSIVFFSLSPLILFSIVYPLASRKWNSWRLKYHFSCLYIVYMDGWMDEYTGR